MVDMSGLREGRICVVTGAGRGIGHERALSLARQGARVLVDDVDGKEAERVTGEPLEEARPPSGMDALPGSPPRPQRLPELARGA